MIKNLSASIRTRLLALAKSQGVDFNQILVRFAMERLLYRLSLSAHADRFVLKGALLFNLWYDMPYRTTRDIDLLGFGSNELQAMAETFRDIASIIVADGIVFDPATISVTDIRKEANYAGVRVLVNAEINNAHCKTQVDIGFGDAVTPKPIQAVYPVLLEDLPAPLLQMYPIYTVIAEKLHAIALLGMTNSRLKDYLDLWILLKYEIIDELIMTRAVATTFFKRGMLIPSELPIGLTDEFAIEPSHQAMWVAFLKKNKLAMVPLMEVVQYLSVRFKPVLLQARNFETFGQI